MFISGRECLTSLMHLCAKDAPLSQEMPTGLPSHDKRQCLHRQAHGTHKFCIMTDLVIMLLCFFSFGESYLSFRFVIVGIINSFHAQFTIIDSVCQRLFY